MNRKKLLLISFAVEGGIFLLGLVLINFSQIQPWTGFSLSWSATEYALLLSFPLLVALYISMQSSWEPLSRFRTELEEKIQPIFTECKLIDLAMIAFLAGTGEELFFRGWLQGVLTTKFSVWLGILIASLIFGLLHYLSTTYAIYAFLTGMYLGLIYQASENLYIVMAIHALYDFIALVYLFKKSKAQKEKDSISATGQQVE